MGKFDSIRLLSETLTHKNQADEQNWVGELHFRGSDDFKPIELDVNSLELELEFQNSDFGTLSQLLLRTGTTGICSSVQSDAHSFD